MKVVEALAPSHAPRAMHDNDPLWKMRHALTGVGLALLISVFIAAFTGAFLGDLFGDSYGARVSFYGALLLYVVVGAGVLFAKVARHETRALSVARLGLWLASLWLWPGLWLATRQPAAAEGSAGAADKAEAEAQGPSRSSDAARGPAAADRGVGDAGAAPSSPEDPSGRKP